MVTSRKVLIGAASALAISALPVKFDTASNSGFAKASAYAKSEKGGGNDKGGGSDRGNGGDRGNGKGGGSSNGKSASAPSKGQSGGGVQTASTGGFMKSLFGGGQSKKTAAQDTKHATPKNAKAKQNPNARAPHVLPASIAIPVAKPAKEKNLHARLAGLNSLNRNYHAYLNSQSPRMALVREYVLNSAKAELATEAAAAATEKAAQSQAALDAALAGIVTYDGSALMDGTQTALADRKAALEALVPADEAEAAAIQKELDGLNAAIAATNDLVAVEQELADAQAAAEVAGEGTSEDDLKEALLAAANPNRVAEYGDDYLNDEVMDWAKSVLGVGDAQGKIDEVKGTLQQRSAAAAPAQPEPVLEPEPQPTIALVPVK
ncbi:hypothetical protein [Mesorhizobium sp. ANAO-SY3R2]|uniref:hypothetical protein n=1 Tax=Mesorhizobium sp. ANAO-SY3R2 TaxID=3166644 RepID=UPI003672ED8C